MKRMTKQVLCILAAVCVVALVLGGCGDPESPASYSYTVTFDKNTEDAHSTGAFPGTKTVTSPATKIDALPRAPTRPGHEFIGWYTTTNAASGTGWSANTVVSGDITVYAKWDSLRGTDYSVAFDKNGGDTEANPAQIVVWGSATSISENDPVNDKNTLPTPPSKADSLFSGWNTQADGLGDDFFVDTTVSAHIVVYAQWDEIQEGNVAVIFWNKDGTTQLKAVQITQGSNISADDFPDKNSIPSYEIVSWRTEAGSAFTPGTSVNITTNVYVDRLKLLGGKPRVVGDTLVHENPLMEGRTTGPAPLFAGTIDEEDGTITLEAGAFQYKFPTLTDTGDSIDISDYAYFVVHYELKSESGNKSGVQLKQYGNDTDYGGKTGNDKYPWLSSQSSLQFWVSGAGTTDGFSMRFSGTLGEPIVVKITSVIFYIEEQHTVTFNLNGGEGDTPAQIQVYDGAAIGSANFPEDPVRTSYTFLGWKNQDGAAVTATTPIRGEWVLTAQWILTSETTPVEVNAPENGTLFAAGNDYAGGTTPGATYTYDGKSYWIVADARTAQNGYKPWSELTAASPPFNGDVTAVQTLQQSYGTIGGYTRIGYSFSSADQEWAEYTKVTIMYDLVQICGNTDILVRDSTDGSSATTVQSGSITAGTNQTLTLNITSFTSGGMSIVKNGNGGAFLLRITQVKLHY